MIEFSGLKVQNRKYKKNIKKFFKIIDNSNFILGNELTVLENKLAKIVKSKYCSLVSSGTSALEIKA